LQVYTRLEQLLLPLQRRAGYLWSGRSITLAEAGLINQLGLSLQVLGHMERKAGLWKQRKAGPLNKPRLCIILKLLNFCKIIKR